MIAYEIMNEERSRIEKLSEKCKLLEEDIKHLTSEIIELELSREQLLLELKNIRRELHKEFEKFQKVNSNVESLKRHKRENSV